MTSRQTARKKIVVVDLFCGGGGFTTATVRAAAAATEIGTFIAVNHDEFAIATHTQNHPSATHFQTKVDAVNPREVVPGGRVHLLLAGPECTHHSNAAGSRPRKDQSRSTAWHILKWLQELYVNAVIIENVPEFKDWGPLGAKGQPIKALRGKVFLAYLEAIRTLGYKAEWRVLKCADYGDPTSRRRLFIIARRDGHPIVWPEPTHADPKRTAGGQLTIITKTLPPYRTAREIIDWDVKGTSIYNRKKPLAPATMARIHKGLFRFGIRLQDPGLHMADPFLVKLFGTSTGANVDDPVPTVTADGQHIAVANPIILSAGGPEIEPRSVDGLMPTVLTREHLAMARPYMLGLGGPTGNRQPRSVDGLVPTIPTTNHLGIAQPYLLPPEGFHRGNSARSADGQVPTITQRGAGAVVQPLVMGQQSNAQARPIDELVPTVATAGAISLLQPWLFANRGGADGYLRGGPVDEPVGALTTIPGLYVVDPQAYLATVSHGAGDGRTYSLDGQVPTIAGGGNLAFLNPIMLPIDQMGSQSDQTRSVDDQVPTITTKARMALAHPFMVIYHGASYPGGDRVATLDGPVPTVAAGGNQFGFAEVTQPWIHIYNGQAIGSDINGPLPTVTGAERLALCVPVLRASQYIGCLLVDILFRMFLVKELAAAMSFPKSYFFVAPKGRKMTTRAAVRMIGNAVAGETAYNLSYSQLTPLLS